MTLVRRRLSARSASVRHAVDGRGFPIARRSSSIEPGVDAIYLGVSLDDRLYQLPAWRIPGGDSTSENRRSSLAQKLAKFRIALPAYGIDQKRRLDLRGGARSKRLKLALCLSQLAPSADVRTRFERNVRRARDKDVEAFVDFEKQDEQQARFGVLRVPTEIATDVVRNNGTLELYKERIDSLIATMTDKDNLRGYA